MTTRKYLWLKHLAIGAAAVALPLAAMADGPLPPEPCPPMAPAHGGPLMPPPGIPPFLRQVELSDAQQDKLFELTLAQASVERARNKEAFKAMDELRRLAATDSFDAEKARALADTYGQAQGQLALLHAEMDAKLHALLTPEQRRQIDDARSGAEAHRHANRRP